MRFIKTETEIIRMSDDRDIPALKKIWKVCFGDSDEAINSFFSGAYNKDTTLVLNNKENAAAMLSMLPIELYSPVGSAKGYYVYAVATLPEYQGRGYMTLLEKECSKIAKEKGGRFCLLVPATKPLFNMYSKLGYKTFSSISTVRLFPTQNFIDTTICDCDFNTFYNLRTEFLSGFAQSVRFIKDYEKYAFNEYLNAGGEIILVGGGYVCAYKKNNLLTITESSHTKDQVESFLFPLLNHTGCKNARMRIPGKDGFSMIKWLESNSIFEKVKSSTDTNYFGFALE